MSFSQELIAPCGINCAVCLVHLREKNNCPGCTRPDNIKSTRRVKCGINFCSEHNKADFTYCFECRKFPCSRLKSLEKRYVEKYRLSIIGNCEYIKAYGFDEFLKKEDQKWLCENCGEVLSVHRSFCLKAARKSIDKQKEKGPEALQSVWKVKN